MQVLYGIAQKGTSLNSFGVISQDEIQYLCCRGSQVTRKEQKDDSYIFSAGKIIPATLLPTMPSTMDLALYVQLLTKT